MKTCKKFASVLLAMIMALALVTTALAEEMENTSTTRGTITIDNAVVGQTYTIYKILTLESYDATKGAYSYKAASEWEGFVESDGIKDAYLLTDDQGYVTWKEGASAGAFAKLAKAWADEHSDSITTKVSKKADSATVIFDGLELGYYLVDSSMGTLCSLDTTTPDVTIKEKNTAPTNEKTVKEDSNNTYGKVNDADFNDTIDFKSTVILPKGSDSVIFHDEMDKGLELIAGSIKVYTDADMKTELASDKYTVTTKSDITPPTDGCTFEIAFTQEYLNSLDASITLYIAYQAKLTTNAVVGDAGNENHSHLSYGDKTGTTQTETPDSETKTYTWSFTILKYGNNDIEKVLAGAKFVLLNSDKTMVAIFDGDQKFTEWENVPAAGEDGTITWPAGAVLTTPDNGKIELKGLDSGTYYLREIEAPNGYNKLADDEEVKIEPTTDTENNKMSLAAVTAEINNNSGSELPSTGGMGTTIFYVLGSILLFGATVLLITKKRMNSNK